MSKFGNASYGGQSQFKKKVYFKLQDGDLVFRILPPFGALAEKGIWSRFHRVHFGYKNMEGKLRTFLSTEVKNNKTKMIEVNDPALDRLNDLKAKLEKSKMEMTGPLTAKLTLLVGHKGVYNLDNNHHMNVMDLNGTVGVLKIRHKAKMALDAEITKLRAEGCDPLSVDNGRYFVFTRQGMGNETGFKVSVYKEKLNVAGIGNVERDVVHVLTPELLMRCEAEASDLDKLFSAVTPEEVAQIVNESDLMTGKSPACDRIFDQRWKAEREARNGSSANAQATQAARATAAAPVAAAAPAEEEEPGDDYTPPPAVVVTAPRQALVQPKPAAVAQAAVVAKTATAQVATAQVAKTQGQSIEELSDDDFFKQIGVDPKNMSAQA